jgi:hypothetical protein
MKVLFRTIEFLAAATAVLIAVIAIFGYFQVGVPVAKFDLRCSPIWSGDDETAKRLPIEQTRTFGIFTEQSTISQSRTTAA